MDSKKNFLGQGAIEYLIILGVVLFIALISVSVTFVALNPIDLKTKATEQELKELELAVVEASFNSSTESFLLRVRNNRSSRVIIKNIKIGDVDLNVDQNLLSGTNHNFILSSPEVCENNELIKDLVIVFEDKYGLKHTQRVSKVSFNCNDFDLRESLRFFYIPQRNLDEGTFSNMVTLSDGNYSFFLGPSVGDAVAYYSFNSSNGSIVKDLVGSADGALGNGASVGVGGKFGSNALIIGDDYQYFDIPNFSSPQITIMGWYYFGSTGGGEWNTIFCREGGYYHHLLINDSSKEVGFYNNAFYSSGVTLTPQTLYHFAVVKDGLVQKIYLNGELIMNSNNSFNNSTYPFGIIGNFNKGGNQGAMGWIDEVKIFNRVLSGEEILAEYNWTLSDVDSSYTTKLINTKKNTSLFDSVIVNPSGLKYGEEIDPNSESSLASGLVGLWHLNDKNSTGWLLNSATGVRDAVLSGDADVSGIGLWDSNAGSFNGTNYIYGSDSGFPSGASPRTISFWAYPILVDSSYHIAFFYGTYSSNAMTEVGIAPNNNWFVSQHGNSVYGSAVAQNEWSFVTVVYDGSVWYFYVNGALVGSGVMSTNTILDQFNIGAERGGQTLFEGTIEEVAIWNRAFSESEVKDLFSKGASRMGVQARACSSEDCSTQWSEVKYGSNDYKYFSLPRSKYFQFKITSELIPFEAQQIIPESCVSTYGANYTNYCRDYFLDYSSCSNYNSYNGCSWVDPYCGGYMDECYYLYDPDSCNSTYGCELYEYSYCDGYIGGYCYNNFKDESSCEEVNECYWGGSACYSQVECYYFGQDECSNYSQFCDWYEYSYCYPTIDCYSLDSSSCNNYRGCYLEGDYCEGYFMCEDQLSEGSSSCEVGNCVYTAPETIDYLSYFYNATPKVVDINTLYYN